MSNPQDAVGAIAQVWGFGMQTKEEERTRKPLITIARDRGSGGDEVARKLAETLGVECYDKELIDRIAKAARADKRIVEALDERVRDQLELWLTSVLSHKKYSATDYRRSLARTVIAIAPLGGVIVGRGCHFILHRFNVFRVRVVGSPEICAQRLADKEGGDVKALLKEVNEINKQRANFLWDAFKSRLDDASQFDLVINTDGYRDLGKAAEAVANAFWVHKASERVGQPLGVLEPELI